MTQPVVTEPLVPLIGPDDAPPRQVPQSQVKLFTDAGYQVDTPEARQQIALQKKYGEGLGNEVIAGGLGAARTLSFGLSDLALAKSGVMSPEELTARKELNPDATLTGEIGAFALPLVGQALGAMGLGTGARLVSGATSGIKGVTALGEALGEATAKATGSTLLGSAAHVAAESLAYNLAHNVSEAALGDKELTAQRLLAHSGQALAIGAGLGFGAPLAVKAIGAAAQKARTALSALGTSLRDKVFPAAAEAAGKGYAQAYGAVTGKGPEAVEQVASMLAGAGTPEGIATREQIIKAVSPEADDELLRNLTQQLGDTHKSVEKIVRQGFKEVRPQEMSKLLADVDVRAGANDLTRLIDEVKTTAQKMADDPLFYDQAYMRGLQKLGEDLDKKLMAGVGSAEELHTIVNNAKSTVLGDLAEFGKPMGNMSRAQQNAVSQVRDVYKEFAAHLEDPALYGEAGAAQQGFNADFSAYKRLFDKGENNFRRFFLTNGDVDVTKVKGFLRKIGSGRDLDAAAALEEFQTVSAKMVDRVEKSAQGIGVTTIDKAGFESLLKKTIDTQTKAANDLAFTNKIRSTDMFGTAFMRFQETVGQTLANNSVLGATMRLAEKAASPFGAVKALSMAEGLVMKTSTRVADTIGRLASRMGGAAARGAALVRPYAEPASLSVLLSSMFGEDDAEKAKNRRDGYKKAQERLAALAADPAGTAEKLANGVQHLAPAAPELAQSVVDTQMRSIAFLDSKAPKNPAAAHTINPFIQDWQPSDMEAAKFERYAAAVADPLSVLDELEHGSVTPEGVEALQAVYPALYDDVRTQLMTKTMELEKTVPYRYRVELSIMFGIALDSTMESGFVNAVQNGYSQPAAQTSKQTAYRPTSAAQKIGALEETQAQRISRR